MTAHSEHSTPVASPASLGSSPKQSEASPERVVESPQTESLTRPTEDNTRQDNSKVPAIDTNPKEDKDFDGIIVINYTPDVDLIDEWDDGFGPSLRKVINVTQAYLKGDRDDDGLKLARVVKLTIMGRWESKFATKHAAEAKETDETKAADMHGRGIATSDFADDTNGNKGHGHGDNCKGKCGPLTKEELFENATAVARVAEVVYLMENLETFE